jgi:membrane-bound metal-dependent hydrolase YbcI (DUF457 family)
MSPVAHSAVGLLGWQKFSEKKNLKTLLIFILMANLPDIDFAFYLFLGEKALNLHQYFTHNVFIVVIAAIACWPLFKTKSERLGILLVALSHLLLDFLTIDRVAPKGFRLFYPISTQLFNFGIFPNVKKSNWAEVFSFHNLLVIGFEAVLFLVPVFLVYRREFAGYLKEKQWWKI